MCVVDEIDEIQEKGEKADVAALPIWMGLRLWDNSDLEEFMSLFSYKRGFVSYPVQDLCEVDMRQLHGHRYLGGVRNLLLGVREILSHAETAGTKVAIFYIVNGRVAESNWGFREVRERMGSGGHTCFDNPEDAVDTVAARIEELVRADLDTPREMIVWKCGSSCAGHTPGSVQKWISDVNWTFKRITK